MKRILHQLIAIVLLTLILGSLSCEVKKEVITVEDEQVFFDEPHILFLTCSVTAKGEKSILKVENKILSKGKLKQAHMDLAAPKVGDWIVTVLDADSNEIASTRLDNPLLYRAEYLNDDGVLETKLIERESGGLSIRLPIEGQANKVIIKRKVLDGFDSTVQIEIAEL